jgi:hypothetical protein
MEEGIVPFKCHALWHLNDFTASTNGFKPWERPWQEEFVRGRIGPVV